MSKSFVWPIRIYYEDTDAAGIVYHARYLHFAERARTEMLRVMDFDHRRLRQDFDLVFAVARCELAFKRPAVLDDALEVRTIVLDQAGARIELAQDVYRGGERLCDVSVRLACLDSQLRPKRLPACLATAFQEYVVE